VTLAQPIRISSRSRSRGGPARFPSSGTELANVLNITIFVHGFNNDEKQAQERWEKTRARVGFLLGASQYLTQVAEYYWPGDRGYGGKFLKSALYAKDVGRARSCGQDLGRFLAQRERRLRVAFVGHSLGCRLILEALRELRASSSPVICTKALLMAAAVPEGLCDDENRFTRAIGTTLLADREEVLYSRNDCVLQTTFLGGQIAAELVGDDYPGPGSRRAVGRGGGPAKRWTAAADTSLGHGDYWLRAESLQHVAKVIGAPQRRVRASRSLPARCLPGLMR
jgi:Alpha/beta hydrolase family